MKSVLLIGLGRFGRHMAQELQKLNHEVLAIDADEQRVNDAMDFVTNGQIGDSTNKRSSILSAYAISTCAWWPSETIFRVLWKPPRCSKNMALRLFSPGPPVKYRQNSC